MDLFDDDWLIAAGQALARLPALEGVDAAIDYVISASPAGKTTIGVTVENGRVTSIVPGKSADPDVVISMKYDAAVKLLTGEMSGDVAFMTGALKVEGAHERWMLDLRPSRVAAVDALASVMAETTV
jgi:putative sterol carrier protein